MVGRLEYLIDTNVWLELLLERENPGAVRRLFGEVDADRLGITEFTLYSIGIILTRLSRHEVLREFLSDVLEEPGVARICLASEEIKRAITVGQELGLSFDDAYQYVAAETHQLALVSFDSDFDRTPRGRKDPSTIVGR